ncbi:MAG: hypothetical protein QOI94_688, partial [Acidobacteriaceae bacterium]|nr:hypothetical protein [Acidobacteriaceae bacterium]
EIGHSGQGKGLELRVAEKGRIVHHLEIYEMNSMWKVRE